MFSALASRLKPKSGLTPPQEIDPATLPDADTVEAQLLAAQESGKAQGVGTGGKPDETPFLIRVHDQGLPSFEERFGEGEIVVGADPECDIVITDIDEAEVLVVKLERIGAACLITLTALCHGISARGRDLPVGRPLVFPDRATFMIAGEYGFEIGFDPGRSPIVEKRSAPVALLAGAVLFAAAGWILSQPAPRPPAPAPAPVSTAESAREAAPATASRSDTRAPDRAPDPVAVITAEAPPVAPDTGSDAPAVDLTEARSTLHTMLSAANLVPPLQLGSRDGVLTVTGALNAAERDRAFEVMHGLRERHRVPIEIAIESDLPAAPFVTAIVLSPETFVIGSDGRRYALGQRLPDGGILEKIDEEAIVVNRNGLLERVNYAW
jgi:hypothetical protein